MAPPFSLATLDGQRISMDGLAGKVVLIDFWATWCGPCREALPHMQRSRRNLTGQPFVVLSVSLDNDEAQVEELCRQEWNDLAAVSRWRLQRAALRSMFAVSMRFPPRSPLMPTACLKTSMWATRILRAS